MIVVLDTNVVLQALIQRHPFAVILHAWHARHFVWALSTDIMREYQEVVVRQSGPARWQILERLLNLAAIHGRNTQRVSTSFFFRTISADHDDDKFADCAIAAHADYVITSDKHFKVLIGSGYKPQPIKPDEFIHRHLNA